MKVEIIENCVGNGYDYSKGDFADLHEDIAIKLINFHYAEEVKEEKKEDENKNEDDNKTGNEEEQSAKGGKKSSKKSGDK